MIMVTYGDVNDRIVKLKVSKVRVSQGHVFRFNSFLLKCISFANCNPRRHTLLNLSAWVTIEQMMLIILRFI